MSTDSNAVSDATTEAMRAADAASRSLGIELDEVAPGRARARMRVTDSMLNGHGICHGGLVFTLADSAFAFACNSYNLTTVASGCTIEFVAPARENDVLTAVAQERSVSGRTGVYDIEVTNQDGTAIAFFRGKSYRIKGHVLDSGEATA
jgi:acyl-CoA thioesterase